jgi:hypothetical protein
MDVQTIWKWLKNRIVERTSWDGIALIVVGVIVLSLGPWAEYVAYAAIALGLYTLVKSETK